MYKNTSITAIKPTSCRLVWLAALVCTHAFAQPAPQPVAKPARPACTAHSRCTDLNSSLRHLGRNLEADVQVAADQVQNTLRDPAFRQGVAAAGREAGEALRTGTYWLNNHSGQDARFSDQEKTKKFSKSIRLSAGQQLAVENKFGKVHVNTWDKPEATVDVVMTARSSSEAKAQTLLDRINIAVEDNKADNETLVKTQLENMNNWGGGKQSFEINYTVNLPRNNPLRVKNSFGDTYVASLNGKANLQCAYGSLKADRLNHAENYIKVSFGNGRVGYCKSGDVKVSYSDLEIAEGGSLQIESNYSELEVRNVQAAVVKTRYGSLDLGTDGKAFKRLDIDGSFSDIDLRLPASLGFDFDIKVSYADLDWNDTEVKFASVEKSGNSRTYTGTCGKAGSGSIRVSSKYGDVDFKMKE